MQPGFITTTFFLVLQKMKIESDSYRILIISSFTVKEDVSHRLSAI